MFKNKHSIALVGITFFFWFFMVMLSAAHLNVLMDYFIATGWSATEINAPQTVGGWASLIMFIIGGSAFVKFGITKVMSVVTVILAIATTGLAFSSGNYLLYSVSLFTVRTFVVLFQLGGMALITNWFIEYRGRALGIATAGASCFSAFGLPILTLAVGAIGMNAYLVITAILGILALLIFFGLKDTPEEVGLYPDGVHSAPVITEKPKEENLMTVKEIFKDRRIWQLSMSLGLMMTSMTAIMGMNSTRFASLTGPEQGNLWTEQVMGFMVFGSLGGIILSYVLGWVVDKYGGVKATLLVALLMFFALIPLAFMPVGGNTLMIASWAFGFACMSGGMSTVSPAIIGEVYGRKQFQVAVKWVMAVNSFLGTFAPTFMGWFYDQGALSYAYYILMGLVVIAIINLIFLMKTPNPNKFEKAKVAKI